MTGPYRDYELHQALRTYAAGESPHEAAVELLIGQRSVLARKEFRATYITRVDNAVEAMASVDWYKIIAEPLPWSSAEGRLLQFAASLAVREVGISLWEVLPGLDAHATGLIASAVCHATGHPQVAGALGAWPGRAG